MLTFPRYGQGFTLVIKISGREAGSYGNSFLSHFRLAFDCLNFARKLICKIKRSLIIIVDFFQRNDLEISQKHSLIVKLRMIAFKTYDHNYSLEFILQCYSPLLSLIID